VRKFLPLVLALMLIAPLSLVPSVVNAQVHGLGVVTHAATNVTCMSATVSATIDAGCPCWIGGQGHFDYGTSPGQYTEQTGDQNASADSPDYSADITLLPCQLYYVRAHITCVLPQGGFQECFGNEIMISTMFCCPPVITHGSSSVGTGTPGGSGAQPSSILGIRPYLPPLFEVQSATVAAAKAAPGEMVEVTAMVTNKGGSNGTSKIILYVNGQEADSKGIALSGGQSAPISFKVSRNDPGTYQVHVNSVAAGSFTVDLFNSSDMLIYGSIALFVIGMVGLLYYILKRRTAV
jgi:hypothetical protein